MNRSSLRREDATRVAAVIDALHQCGFRGSLTGSLAIQAHLHASGEPPTRRRRSINDVDFVTEDFATLPAALADRFLVSHVHPLAPEGKLLVQLIDRTHALRVDVFRAFGRTLRRAHVFAIGTRPLSIVALEDLVARMTSHVFGHLSTGRWIERKYVETLLEILPFRVELPMDEAWQDHRQAIDCSFEQACEEACRLIAARPDLLIEESYSTTVIPCERCHDHGAFRCAAPDQVVDLLGYW